MMAFINDYGKRLPAADTEGLYARLVWTASCCERGIANDPALDWQAVRHGIDAILRDYPAQSNVQRYLFLACSHPDKAEVLKLLPLVDGPTIESAVGRGNVGVFGSCLDWARGKIPEFAMRDHETGEVKLIH